MTEKAAKEKGWKRILRNIKGLFFRVFGKARWFLIGVIVTLFLQIATASNFALNYKIEGVQDENEQLVQETGLKNVSEFTINNKGRIAVACDIGRYGLVSVFDPDTAEQSYAGNNAVIIDPWKDEYFNISDFVLTDDDELYAVRRDSGQKLSIVKLSKEYGFLDDVCTVAYDKEENQGARLSRLHYYENRVTFAMLERKGFRLYSLDTKTDRLELKESYPKEENGNIVVNVIPIDGAFLILYSDGKVYRTTIGDPEESYVCCFDTAVYREHPYFTQATVCNGELFFFDENVPDKVYRLEDEQAKVVLDITQMAGYEDSYIVFLDSYGMQENGGERLSVCLNNGLLTWTQGTVTANEVNIKIKPWFLYYAREIWEWIFGLSFWGLIIHLIIRRKTLFYKQLLVTLPVFLIMTIAIILILYDYTLTQKMQNIRNETEIICEFGAKELEGFDFYALRHADADTGTAYQSLYEKLKEIDSVYTKYGSENYVLSVVCRTGKNIAAVLIDEKTIGMPTSKKEMIASRADFLSYDSTGNSYVSETMQDLFSVNATESGIFAYGKIRGNGGEYYLKVSTESEAFNEQRGDIVFPMILYSVLIILLLTAILLFSSLRTTEVIRNATGVLKKISDGDLTARIRYSSRDELGEICTQVNAMGNNLEENFAEKDRTEKFYYRFVPEQFRTLLGKEKFTDLALGDSASRELTVLFCDIRSSAMNSDTTTAAENFAFVNAVYGVVGPIIRGAGGFVDKYMGNAIMALFESADDAVKAGIEIYRAIVSERRTIGVPEGSDINIGIGIHSGMARIGIVGEEERLSGTVISDTVNLSSRLESLTRQYQTAILISKDCVDRMADPEALALRYLGIIQVAGVNEAKSVYEVLDCLAEGEKQKRNENAAMLREAVRLFHLGRREESADMLRDLSTLGKADHVTEMYLEYIQNLPAEDKGNVFRFVRK